MYQNILISLFIRFISFKNEIPINFSLNSIKKRINLENFLLAYIIIYLIESDEQQERQCKKDKNKYFQFLFIINERTNNSY